jgi:DNA repair photolyase
VARGPALFNSSESLALRLDLYCNFVQYGADDHSGSCVEQAEQLAVPSLRGRGTSDHLPNRFDAISMAYDPEAEVDEDGVRRTVKTKFFVDASKSILAENDSPDLGFKYSANPYRGCEHGCVYCFARPSHEYLSFDAGLDFETKILVKTRAPELLRDALRKPSWQAETIVMSGNTDCYQPAEKHFRLTRGMLEVCAEARQPVTMLTKGSLVTRDIDVLQRLAAYDAIYVNMSLTSLDHKLAGRMEPRAARPEKRLQVIRDLAMAGIPVGVIVGPVIPALNDHEIPALLQAAAEAGASNASWVMLRLAAAVADIVGALVAAALSRSR